MIVLYLPRFQSFNTFFLFTYTTTTYLTTHMFFTIPPQPLQELQAQMSLAPTQRLQRQLSRRARSAWPRSSGAAWGVCCAAASAVYRGLRKKNGRRCGREGFQPWIGICNYLIIQYPFMCWSVLLSLLHIVHTVSVASLRVSQACRRAIWYQTDARF